MNSFTRLIASLNRSPNGHVDNSSSPELPASVSDPAAVASTSRDEPSPQSESYAVNDATERFAIDPERGVVLGTSADLSEEEPDVVHGVLRKTDVWFGYRLAELEKEAIELATSHARMGQPRHDLDRNRPLEIEVLLEQHARETLSGWADRVKRRMQGAVGRETEKIGAGLEKAREALANAAAARDAIAHQNSRIVQHVAVSTPVLSGEALARGAASPVDAPEAVECERHLAGYWFWPLMLLLVLADFFANVPVFVELFPMNKVVDEAFTRWEADVLAEGLPTWFGFAHLLKKIAIYPEPSILALSVVVFFLFLGHTFGGSFRALVVLWKHRTESVSRTLRSFSRQAGWPAAMSLIGIVLTVSVLYEARSRVLPMAERRFVEAEQVINDVERRMSELQGQGASLPAEIFQELAKAQEERETRVYRVDYARAIGGMNLPIALLNVVLVIAAIIIGYLRENRRFEVVPTKAPALNEESQRRMEVAKLERERMDLEMRDLLAAFATHREAAHQAIRVVGNAILRVEQLLKAPLLGDSYSKAERLRAVIPIFRVENARLRGLDVEDILAFRNEYEMRLPTTDELGPSLDRPLALDGYRSEYGQLERELHELDRAYPAYTGASVPSEATVQEVVE